MPRAVLCGVAARTSTRPYLEGLTGSTPSKYGPVLVLPERAAMPASICLRQSNLTVVIVPLLSLVV